MNVVIDAGFQSQRYENQSNNMNFNGAGQRSNFNNQSSQYQKLFSSNNNSGYTRNYGASSYKNTAPATQENKLESLIDQVLEEEQKMAVKIKFLIDYRCIRGHCVLFRSCLHFF